MSHGRVINNIKNCTMTDAALLGSADCTLAGCIARSVGESRRCASSRLAGKNFATEIDPVCSPNPSGIEFHYAPSLYLSTHAFKFLHIGGDLLEHALLLGQILRIQRAHLGQHGVQFRAVVARKFPFE